jgi:hypothetical protein
MKHVQRGVYYFELVKASGRLVRWSLVIRNLFAGDWTDIQGQRWEYQGPYTRNDAEPIYNAMIDRHGQPVRRAW